MDENEVKVDGGKVEISLKQWNEYQDLLLKMSALEALGVDNWEGYPLAMDEYRRMKSE